MEIQLQFCEFIGKGHVSFKNKIWGWLLLHHGLDYKSRLHKIGTIRTYEVQSSLEINFTLCVEEDVNFTRFHVAVLSTDVVLSIV